MAGLLKSLFGGNQPFAAQSSQTDPDRNKKPKSVSDQSSEEIDMAQKLRAELESNRSSANRIAHEGIWMTNCAYCVSGDSVIATANGYTAIEKLTTKDLVKTRDGYRRVLRVWDNGTKTCYDHYFSDGSILKCTDEHKIYTKAYGWVQAQNLQVGMHVISEKNEDVCFVKRLCVGPQHVFDLTIETIHEYFANGILVHNCLGYDGLMYNTTARQFQPINRASAYLRRNRIHANKILPTVQNRLARLCQNPPEYDIVPETDDVEDKDAAKLSMQVLNTQIERLEVNKKRLFLYMWMQQCGHSYIHVKWNPLLGDPMILEDGTLGYQGDVDIEVESAFSVFPDPFARTDDDAQYLMLAKVRPLHYFQANYPERGHLVKEEAAWLLSAQYEMRVNSLNSRGPSQGGLTEQMKNSAIEMIKYEKPSAKFPQGRMIAAANGVFLDSKDLPIGEIPLTKFDDTIIGGKYYSETPVTHARPIQDQYNETLRRRAEWTRRMLAGKYKAPRGSGLAQEAMNDESGEVLYYNVVPSAPQNIEPLPVPTIPEYAYTEEERLDKIMDYIFGIGDVSRGILPSASIPAIGAQLLQEQDQTRLSVITELLERSWSKVFRQILKQVEKNYEMPRKMKLAGKSGEYIIRELDGRLLRGNTDVRVVRGSTLPDSKTLKRQDIVNTMSLGLLGDPKSDPSVAMKILDALEFGQSQEIFEDQHIDMAQIKRGMDALEKGEFVEIDKKDNNILWCQELNRFRKSDKWGMLPEEIRRLFEAQMEDRLNQLMPPGPSNTPMPPLPPMPPPPIGAGGEAIAGLPPGANDRMAAKKAQFGAGAPAPGPAPVGPPKQGRGSPPRPVGLPPRRR